MVFCRPAPGAGGFDPDPGQTLAREVTLLGVDRPWGFEPAAFAAKTLLALRRGR